MEKITSIDDYSGKMGGSYYGENHGIAEKKRFHYGLSSHHDELDSREVS